MRNKNKERKNVVFNPASAFGCPLPITRPMRIAAQMHFESTAQKKRTTISFNIWTGRSKNVDMLRLFIFRRTK